MKRIGHGFAASLGAVLWTAAVQASCPSCNVTLTYPGTAPCDTTLQACIDSAAAGNTVQIATDGPIAESLVIPKSLTLIAATGFSPLFAGTQSITVNTPSTGPNAIHIEGLTFEQGNIQVAQQSTGVLNVRVIGNTIDHSPASFTAGIDLLSGAGVLGQVTFDLSGNTITVPAGQYGTAIGINLGANTSMSGRIADNSITLEGSSVNGSGIEIGNTGHCVASTNVDVIANRVVATAQSSSGGISGISATQTTGCPGPIMLRVLDNQVTSPAAVNQPLDAIILEIAGGTFSGTVVNNTVTGFQNGIWLAGNASATVSGLVANNIVSSCDGGILFDSAIEAGISNLDNLLFDNNSEQFTPGPNTLTSDPLFVNAGSDYRLRPGSPAIDAGDAVSVPGDLGTDLAGGPRVVGASVDIGAYEAPEPAASVDAAAAAAVLTALCLARDRRPAPPCHTEAALGVEALRS